MIITVVKLQGKEDSQADYVSIHKFAAEKDADSFIKRNTLSGKHWTVAFVAGEGDEYETYYDSN